MQEVVRTIRSMRHDFLPPKARPEGETELSVFLSALIHQMCSAISTCLVSAISACLCISACFRHFRLFPPFPLVSAVSAFHRLGFLAHFHIIWDTVWEAVSGPQKLLE